MPLEQSDNAESRSIAAGGQSDCAGLSQSVQSLYQPLSNFNSRRDLQTLDFGTGTDLYGSEAYTGERLFASAIMGDEPEQKLEAAKIQPPSDALARPSVIRTKEDEAIWDEMQKPHKLGKHESATHIGLSEEVIAEMKAKGQASKFEFFDSAAVDKSPAEQVLLASNITPNAPNLEHKQPYQDIQSDSIGTPPEAIIAKNLGQQLQQVYDGVRNPALRTDIVRVAVPSGASDRVVFPYRGSEDLRLADCTKQDPQAWNNAFESFPDLKQYLSEQNGIRLMRGLVRNELHNYDVMDGLGDSMVKHGHVNQTETLGYAQITPVGLKQFETRYPQLKEFLESKGYVGPNAEANALRDPSCVPMIVAAKLQSEVDALKTAHDKLHPGKPVEINSRTLAYTYNADVYYNPNSLNNPDFHASIVPKAKEVEHLRGYEKAYPTSDERVLNQSQHIKNVEEQMRLLH